MSYSIEPRLYEYMRKKTYYNTHNITPDVSLETEFMITQNDMLIIKKYLSDERNNLNAGNEFVIFPVKTPKIQYNQQLHYDRIRHKHEKNESGIPHNPSNDTMMHYFDETVDEPIIVSNIFANERRVYNDNVPNDCKNMIRQVLTNPKKINPDIMSELVSGMPSHTRKTYGYDDAFEHTMGYIDGDIQSSNHTVLPFPRGGVSSRLSNKQSSNRTIY